MECVSEDARCWQVEHEADSLPHEVVAVNESIKQFCSECGEVKRVGNYFVGGQELGEGMFAKVKKGIHALTGELVAIKITDKKHKNVNEYVLTHLHREAKLLKRLRHPNIVQAFEVMETDSKFYLVQELCPKGDLMRYVEQSGPLSEKETRKYMRQLVSAIDYLHQATILHRDLKLENILFDSNKNTKLIDFGLSNNFGGETVCGSPAYSSPEVLGAKHYGPEADIWSLGVNMFAMLTGTLPYSVNVNAKNVITLLHVKMLEKKMNPIPSNLSEECKDLLLKLLEFDPAKRIKMNEILIHPWLSHNPATPLTRCVFPNQLADSDLNDDILAHMKRFMQNECKSSLSELTFALLNQELSADAAIYHLLEKKLHRYEDNKSKELISLNRRRKKSSSETDIVSVLDKINHDQMRRTSSLSKKTKSLKTLNERSLKRMQSDRTLPHAYTPAATPQVAKVRTRHTTEPVEPTTSEKLGLPMLSPKSPTEKQTFQDFPPIATNDTEKVLLPSMHHRTSATAYSKDRRDSLLQWVNKPSTTANDRIKRNRSFRVAVSDPIEHAYLTLPPERQPSLENLSVITESTNATFETASMLSIHSVECDALDCSRQQHNFLAASPPFMPSQPPPLHSMHRGRTMTVHSTRQMPSISDQPLPSINQRASSLPRNPKLKKWHSERIKRKH